MKIVLTVTLILTLFLNCGKKESKSPASETAPTSPEMKKMDSPRTESLADEEEAPSPVGQAESKNNKEGIIKKVLDPISEAAKGRLLEYTVQLNYKVDSIDKAREVLLTVIKKESYITSSQTNQSGSYENMNLQIQIPVAVMYDTLLAMDKVGDLTYENIYTTDWTEHNELQKYKISREAIRMVRRAQAANRGSAETWNWKDREEALERSEDNADSAKLESWKIKDRVTWAKVNINLSGKELPTQIRLPNYKDALVGALNFLLELTYYITYLIPLVLVGFLLFKLYRKIRK